MYASDQTLVYIMETKSITRKAEFAEGLERRVLILKLLCCVIHACRIVTVRITCSEGFLLLYGLFYDSLILSAIKLGYLVEIDVARSRIKVFGHIR